MIELIIVAATGWFVALLLVLLWIIKRRVQRNRKKAVIDLRKLQDQHYLNRPSAGIHPLF